VDSEWTSDPIILAVVIVCVVAVVAAAIIVVALLVHWRKKNAADPAKSKLETAQLVPQESNETIRDMIDGTGSGSGQPFQLVNHLMFCYWCQIVGVRKRCPFTG